jgi:hypothetical protein
MKFHLITGFGRSSYINNDEDTIGQGVLQGSSSAAPIFLLNSEVSLCAYNKIGIGASFCHPVDGSLVTDCLVQFVDDTSQFVNILVATNHTDTEQDITPPLLLPIATKNAQKWADLIWMSGGGELKLG